MSHYERLARNPMTYDFGFDNGESEELIILGWLNYLEHSFDLVMIMEHFDESLILLKVPTYVILHKQTTKIHAFCSGFDVLGYERDYISEAKCTARNHVQNTWRKLCQ